MLHTVSLVEFGVDVDQVISTCTDRGANVLKACKDLFGENKVTSCVCHLADNVVQDSLYSLPIVNALLKDVKQIAGFIKRSPTAANLLRTFQMQTGKTSKKPQRKAAFETQRKKAAIEGNKVFCAANLVDPRFKGLSLSKEQFSAAAELIKSRMTMEEGGDSGPAALSLGSNKDQDDILLEMFYKMEPQPKRRRTVHQEFNDYFDSPVEPYHCDPWKWWQENAVQYPALASVARDLFVVQPSSVQSERIVSSVNAVLTDERSS
ncbi:Hypothetical predicted protein [Cloeon dipterum]|uniref:HAT C-terminal dimerisation domain-containing protein n=1 Tax=Cloeon dipterum TaxID=197152 RepID=A0A8S1DPB1_9INSE|nr:Hypothetical predicted protein [Cloeon dipterum]